APIPEFPLLGSALRIPCQQPLKALNIKPAGPRQIPSSIATRVAAQTSSRAGPWCMTVRARTSSVKLTAKDSTERQAGVLLVNRATPGEALNSGEHQTTKAWTSNRSETSAADRETGTSDTPQSGLIGASPSVIIEAWESYLRFHLQQRLVASQKTMVKKEIVREKLRALKARYPEIAQYVQLKQRYEDLLKLYIETRTEYRDTLSRIAAAKTRVAQVGELQEVMEGICRQSEITTRASSTPQTLSRAATSSTGISGFRGVSGAPISVTGKRRAPFL
ncbi:hypothetical protein FOZ63_018890, partial [Perkinsus olseni]